MVIFLDADGVMWTPMDIIGFLEGIEAAGVDPKSEQAADLISDEWGQRWSPVAKHALNWLLKETGALLVMSASMRAHGLEEMRRMWKARGMYGEVYDITPHLDSRIRGEEIQAWLDAHPQITNYVIVDDDADMLESQMDNFVQTDDHAGLTPKTADKIEAILKRKK